MSLVAGRDCYIRRNYKSFGSLFICGFGRILGVYMRLGVYAVLGENQGVYMRSGGCIRDNAC